MNKKFAIAGLSAGLAVGSIAGLVITVPSISGAQTSAESTATDSARPDRTTRINEVLKPLVDAGTITQAQADAVSGALVADHEARGGHGSGGAKGARSEVLAQALGMSTDDLRTAVESGKTIAQVAADQNVDVQVVIDALTAEATTHIAEKVANGEMTQAEADAKLAELETRITDMVNNPRPADGGRGPGGRGGRGGHGPRGEAPADAGATMASPSA
jgi:polyhydroxyalkanoate synthesis regulator phasin